MEIERKFLINPAQLSEIIKSSSESHSITQFYLVSEGTYQARVRILDDKAFLTVKSNNPDIARFEKEMEIPVDAATSFASDPNAIMKTRHIVNYHGHKFEIDVFCGRNAGLILAEVELESANEPVDLPAFIGQEVTGDKHYYNNYIYKHGYKASEGSGNR